MNNFFLFATFLCTAIGFSQTPCVSGFAGPYPCNGYDLMSSISLSQMNANIGNDSWGWTDPDDGKEYALMGLDNGTAFIDVSDPVNPIYLGKLPTHTDNSLWRDIKVFNNHAFVVSEAFNHGMQVFDLTRLRNVTNPPVTFDEDAHYNQFGNAHNIAINEETGFAYVVGTQTFNGGGHYIDINDPLNPSFAGGFSEGNYSHDAQILVYQGPDPDYIGSEIYIGSNEDRIVIIDVTDKNNPETISTIFYANDAYTHQGWLTEDNNYFILGDELDERDFGFDTTTIVFDFSDLDNPNLSFVYTGPTPSIDHNGYTRGNKFYLSNYRAGMRVLDITDIANGVMTEEAFFDTYPDDDNTNFDGAWNVYPYFESGNIVISDINGGFFLVRDPDFLAVSEIPNNVFSMSPNPASDFIKINSTTTPLTTIEIYNVLGQRVKQMSFDSVSTKTINIDDLQSGMYLVEINNKDVLKLIKE